MLVIWVKKPILRCKSPRRRNWTWESGLSRNSRQSTWKLLEIAGICSKKSRRSRLRNSAALSLRRSGLDSGVAGGLACGAPTGRAVFSGADPVSTTEPGLGAGALDRSSILEMTSISWGGLAADLRSVSCTPRMAICSQDLVMNALENTTTGTALSS